MAWERMRTQLENILRTPVGLERMTAADWKHDQVSLVKDEKLYFCLQNDGKNVHALALEHPLLSNAERMLVELAIAAQPAASPVQQPLRTEEETRVKAIRDWLTEQLEQGFSDREMPNSFASFNALYTSKIPILIYSDDTHQRNNGPASLKKLLESFFEAEMILIPLTHGEWLVLGPETLIKDSEADSLDGEGTVEETLAAIGYGMYEMIAAEWIGECHLALSYPIIPAKSLLGSVIELRESIGLGRANHVGNNIHLPWKLIFDRLLGCLTEEDQEEFLKQILKRRTEHLLDGEMLHTLEHFFELDCNVSETAKQLYIHRNTLLYRLDKFKNETGLDVRRFNDAVLVKVALQLYKITK